MELESKICKCSCQCNAKLLTITSQKRMICSDCIIGNCKGKGVLKSFYGGRFETDISAKSTFNNTDSVKQAYPFQMDVEEKEDK